ncbi:hypothetical protein SESBI_17373 [Sesbania bispinosa]|nr:hypothetical protein SESBI_17373 [Sesbania bispinosa]
MEVSKQRKANGQEQFKLSTFATSGQAKGMTQPKVPSQNTTSSQQKGMTQNQVIGQAKGMTQQNGEFGEEEELGDESANEEENFMEQEECAQKEGGKQMKMQLKRAKKENGEEITQAECSLRLAKAEKEKTWTRKHKVLLPNLRIQLKTPLKMRHFIHCLVMKSMVEFVVMEELSHLQFLKKMKKLQLSRNNILMKLTGMKREMEGLKSLVKTMLKQQNPNLNEDEVDNMMAAALGYEITAGPRSSASSHVPHQKRYPLIFVGKDPSVLWSTYPFCCLNFFDAVVVIIGSS